MDPEANDYPFLTRKMLAFEGSTTFSLQVQTRGEGSENYQVIGATKDGTFVFSFDGNSNRLLQTFNFAIPDVPIFVTVRHNGIAENQGRRYATVLLRMNETPVLRLCAGYIGTQESISWPAVQAMEAMPGRGSFKGPGASNPAAGSQFTITVPDNEIWIVKGLQATLVTDANVANRTVTFTFQLHGGSATLPLVSPTTQAAGLTYKYNVYPFSGALPAFNGTNVFMTMPQELVMQDNDTIVSTIANGQVGDDWGTPNVLVEKFVLSLTD